MVPLDTHKHRPLPTHHPPSYDCLKFVGPSILHSIIMYLQDTDNKYHTPAMGFWYVVILGVSSIVATLVLHQYFFRMFRVGQHLRTAVIIAVYRKVRAHVHTRTQPWC